jgi:NAD(P)H-hydrate epimerase
MDESFDNVQELPGVPLRPAESHKGTFGTVIVVGGSALMPGAPALCAAGALRSGVGLVKIASHPNVIPAAISIEPSATGIALNGRDDLEQIDAADPKGEAILAVGPGLGGSDWAAHIVGTLVRGHRPMVFDADALTLLAMRGDLHRGAPAPLVLTPHPGEFARLARPLGIHDSPTDPETRPSAAAKLAQAHRAVVVLKGQHTIVTDGRKVYINRTGNPALATAGSGDVLTGTIAALMAQGLDAFDAAQLGTYLHGLAGDLWNHQHGPSGLTARDLANLLPAAFQKARNG